MRVCHVATFVLINPTQRGMFASGADQVLAYTAILYASLDLNIHQKEAVYCTIICIYPSRFWHIRHTWSAVIFHLPLKKGTVAPTLGPVQHTLWYDAT